jgi:hypothetical protein
VKTEEKLGWALSPAGNVVLTMTPDDWEAIVSRLGMAAAHVAHARPDVPERAAAPGSLSRHLALMNRINDGNPNWTPYNVPAEARHD